MTHAEYNRLVAAAREEYEGAARTSEAKLAETLRALEVVQQLWSRAIKPPRIEPDERRPRLIEMVRMAIKRVEPEFTLHDVKRIISESAPHVGNNLQQTSVSTALRRLTKANEIELIEPGSGKRPSRYRRKTDRLASNADSAVCDANRILPN